MKVLFITTAHNSMSQRAYVELTDRDHQVSIHLTSTQGAMIEAVETTKPELIIAPFLKTAIPEEIWTSYKCIIIHPGIKGDRGPSSIDWAILNNNREWGVTLLQADLEMDAGDIWFTDNYPMRAVSKSVLYRHEVSTVAIKGLLHLLDKIELNRIGKFNPEKLDYSKSDVKGSLMPTMKQIDRKINWQVDSTEVIVRKIRSADSNPGVLDTIFGEEYYLYGAHFEDLIKGEIGKIIGYRDDAILIGTIDGSVWISHVKKKDLGIKLPATVALKHLLIDKEEILISPFDISDGQTYREIYYKEKDDVGYLHFDFYNGAMSTIHCERLLKALVEVKKRDIKVLVLMGGHDFWSNGINLNTIEYSKNQGDESWYNINAIDDIVLEIINTEDKLVISAMQGNSGAGGVILGIAADYVYARDGVILNPHYKKMGNLYGSEYWTYLLPKRVGKEMAMNLIDQCQPIGTLKSKKIGLVDDFFGVDNIEFVNRVTEIAEKLSKSADYETLISNKRENRKRDEGIKPLSVYREEELEHMKANFYGQDRSYHIARKNFVHKIPCANIEIILT